MKQLHEQLLAGFGALVTVGATIFSAIGIATADETPDDPVVDGRGTGGNAYALGGAHVLGIPYEEYIRREGADWFPNLKRQIVDYPAGQVQGHVMGRLFPEVRQLDEVFPGLGMDGPSVGESVDIGQDNLEAAIRSGGPGTAIGLSEGALVLDALQARLATDPTAPPPDQLTFATFGDPVARHAFGESFLTAVFPVGSIVPALDYRVPPPVESQYDTHMFISAYDSIADFPDRPDNLMSLANTLAGLVTGHTAVAFTNPSMVPPQNIRTTVNSRGAKTTTYLIPERHLPLVMIFQYFGVPEDTLNQLDAELAPMVNAGYSRNDDPLTAPVQLDPVNGYDPAAVTAPATQATFGGGADPFSQILSGALYALNQAGHGGEPKP
ncbi:PE-PPE domain-containing protein [Mycobacterium intermedium]|uniref:acyltransferase PE n=1 Tax=Mycobacterium intermedium TaxID=28445 RepID=UPI000848CBD0|nr:acyltransferase PE [Mycobacterium intermedium]MCV6964629.1 PE-PPE domain-containing protein [Mycobacterium intermedium]ODR03183.1 PE-PPE domain-containing protein [Mycobacterium intermedium]OPE46470.1 PE-PPE domain-containing protein [Mycobacterium intermedium]